MTDWQKYQSHKIIQAAKVVGFDIGPLGRRIRAMVDPGDGVPVPFRPNVAEMLDKANVGDWAMLYPDGYRSISPAKAFEEGYAPVQRPAPSAFTA